MPPKPWETSAVNKDRIEANDIAGGSPYTSTNALANNNLQEQSMGGNPLNGTNDLMNNNNNYSSYNSTSPFGGSGLNSYGSSYGGGYGSSFGGGYGSSFGGGYGSSYGGFGRSSYGMGGGYGRPGMGGPNQQGNFMEFALRYLDSFSYGVSSLCEMTRNIEMNAEGLSRFWVSMRNILVRLFGWFVNSFKGGKELLFKCVNKLREKLFSKAFLAGLLLSNEGSKIKVYNIFLRFCIITLGFTLIAPLMKMRKI